MPDSEPPHQLAFALEHSESHAPEDFLAGPSNAAALALVERWPDWPSQVVALVGPEGAGKSHLASVWAARAGAPVLAGAALAGSTLPDILADGALVLEDLSAETIDERALFHLLNLAREERAFVLLTARTPPATWPVRLNDLTSRLRALPVVTLAAPDDTLLRAVLIKLFSDRQLNVDESLVAYVASRIERSFAAARAVVAKLDREALSRGRPVTRALAGEVLREPGT